MAETIYGFEIGNRVVAFQDLKNVDGLIVVPLGTTGTVESVEDESLSVEFDNGVFTCVAACPHIEMSGGVCDVS